MQKHFWRQCYWQCCQPKVYSIAKTRLFWPIWSWITNFMFYSVTTLVKKVFCSYLVGKTATEFVFCILVVHMDLDIHFGQWHWLVWVLSETKKSAPGTWRDLLAEVMKASSRHYRLCRMAGFSVSHLDRLGKPNWNACNNREKVFSNKC